MKTVFNRWPGGCVKCLTLSYDDGVVEDRQLVSIINRYGIRGTFHLTNITDERRISPSEIAELYSGHEVSVHSARHPFMTYLSREEIIAEVMDNRRFLESLVGYPVDGMSYPQGDYDGRTIELLRACGIRYSRTVQATGKFSLPENWLEWHPTCHHKDCLQTADEFLGLSTTSQRGLYCFYVWGHSYEFDRNKNWDMMEAFCSKMAGREDLWYATNMEIVDYIEALRQIRSSADGNIIHNPSGKSVWLSINDGWRSYELKSGETLRLDK